MDERIKKIIVAVVSGLFLVGVAIALSTARPPRESEPAGTGAAEGGRFPTAAAEPARHVTVPNGASDRVPENVARPTFVSNPDSAGIRSFSLAVSNGLLSPDTVIVKLRDIVRLTFASADKKYDFYQPEYGWGQSVAKGRSASLEFQASAAGTFTFFCRSCGGPERGPRGTLIVVSK